MIQAVLFDLDGTLLDRDASVRRLVNRQYHTFSTTMSHVPKDAFITRFMELDARGYVGKDEVYRQLANEFQLNDATLQTLYDYFYTHYHQHCVPFPGLLTLLKTLVTQGIKLGIITNGGQAFQTKSIDALKIAPYFSTIVTSEQEGIRKPDPQIFQRALQRLGATANAAAFVGDHPIADVGGAQRAGLKAIWKRDPFWQAPAQCDGIINQLSEIVPLIQRWGRGQ